MEIKTESYNYKNMSDIFIKRIKYTKETILKILDLFAWINVVVEISNVQKSDTLFEKIKQLNLKYTTSLEDESPYFNVVLMASIEQFKELIGCIFDSDSEAFAVTNIGNEIQWEQYLYNKIPVRKLIKQGKIDISISVAIGESAITISLSKDTYNTKLIAMEIKALF